MYYLPSRRQGCLQECNASVTGPGWYLGQGILLATLWAWEASDLSPSLGTKCCVNAFIDYSSGNVCLLAWWAGGYLAESWASDPVPCVPLAGKAAAGSAESFSVFSLNAAI